MDGWYLLGYSYSINWKQRFYLLTNLLTYLLIYLLCCFPSRHTSGYLALHLLFLLQCWYFPLWCSNPLWTVFFFLLWIFTGDVCNHEFIGYGWWLDLMYNIAQFFRLFNESLLVENLVSHRIIRQTTKNLLRYISWTVLLRLQISERW